MEPEKYLGADDIIETSHPEIVELAASLRADSPDDVDYAWAAFNWVRDNVAHSVDAQDSRITLTASDVLRERVGFCYAKTHLLAALLRAQGIPAGLCYQRLADGDGGHVLHGVLAVHLKGAWHRQDPRGNAPGFDAQFSLEQERLVWTATPADGEIDYPTVYASPAPEVIGALLRSDDALLLMTGGLPSALAK